MNGWRQEVREQATLAGPVILVNLAMMAMGVVDARMLGHGYSTDAFAAVRLGHAYLWCFLSFGVGTLLVMDPLVSQAVGARDERQLSRHLQRGVVVAILLSVPIGLFVAAIGPVLTFFAQPAELVPTAADYARVSWIGVPFLLWFTLLRQTLQALGRLRAIVFVAVVANVANVGMNSVLIHGRLGFPELGALGSAWATVGCQVLMVTLLLWLERARLRPHLLPFDRTVLRRAPFVRLLRLGMPIGVQVSLESAAFNAVTFLMGFLYGPAEMAGHSGALILASLAFMVPLGLSTAAAVRTGHAIGAGDGPGTRRAAAVAVVLGALVMLVFGATLLLFPETLASFFSQDPAVLAVMAALLPVAGVFQIVDGLQVVASGVLRGSGDTRWPMLLNLVGYWVVGLPAGYVWARHHDGGPRALWWGLAGGLLFVAVTLLLRMRHRLAKDIARLDLEHGSESA